MTVPVYFATNRNLILGPVPNNFGTDFSVDGSVAFGRATLMSVGDESEIGNSNLTIDSLSTITFLQPLQDEIVNSESDHLLIYLHGFDYRFREVVMRSGFLGDWYRRGAPSVASAVVAFSWPSQGCLNFDAYRTDYNNAGKSGGAFRSFLQAVLPILSAFKNQRPGRRVSLMAHSLGNHFLRSGLQAAIGTAPGQIKPSDMIGILDRALLVASDEDADALSRPDGLTQLLSIASKVYVYYNNQDIALNVFSRPLNGVGRLGIDGPPDKRSFIGKNIAFVNCSAANPELKNGLRLDPQWHQYYRLVPEVRDDICAVMAGREDNEIPNRLYREQPNYYRVNSAP